MKNKNGWRKEISLLEYWALVKKRKCIIAIVIVVMTVSAVIYSLMLPNMYKAKATIMPLGGMGGGMNMLASQLGGLASLAGLGGVNSQSPAQKLMALLKTKKLAENVIKSNKLMPVLFEEFYKRRAEKGGVLDDEENAPTIDSAIDVLLGAYMEFLTDLTSGTIMIMAESKDPDFSGKLANWYVDALQDMINESALSMEKRNRIFIEKQLAENKMELLEAGKALNEFYKRGKISSVHSMLDVPVDANFIDTIKKKATEKDDANKEGERSDRLSSLMKKKNKVDNMIKSSESHNGKGRFVYNVPQQVYLQYLTMRMNLLSEIATLLAQQYEMAKIEEAKEDLSFQLIDPARVPQGKSRPKRKMIVMASFAGSIFLALLVIFALEYIQRMKREHNLHSRAR
jgi:uncharacterized protein involved in exopolysaccharide biosynthesis